MFSLEHNGQLKYSIQQLLVIMIYGWHMTLTDKLYLLLVSDVYTLF